MPRSRLHWHALSSSAQEHATAVLGSQVLYTCSPQKESIINNAILNRIAALYVFLLHVAFQVSPKKADALQLLVFVLQVLPRLQHHELHQEGAVR